MPSAPYPLRLLPFLTAVRKGEEYRCLQHRFHCVSCPLGHGQFYYVKYGEYAIGTGRPACASGFGGGARSSIFTIGVTRKVATMFAMVA